MSTDINQSAEHPADQLIDNPSVGFVSLGCPKAMVDSERIITLLRADGYRIGKTYDDSDVIIVNTCGFLNSAKADSLSAIDEALLENGRVIVTGCMGNDPVIKQQYPKVLSVTGPQQYDDVVSAVRKAAPMVENKFTDLIPYERSRITPKHYAYLKISEGCNNKCTFCIIPDLRGKLDSMNIAKVMRDAEKLVESGVKELIVISQDTSAYGLDIGYETGTWRGEEYKSNLYDLTRALGKLGVWVRMQYVYPYPHVDKIIEMMADKESGVLPYIDVPFQHASPSVLKRMRRPANQHKLMERLNAWREICPELTIRSTFIVGFPGETDEDFELLLQFLRDAKLARVGAFKYENVDGAQAHDFEDQVPQDVIDARYNAFMECQQEVSEKLMNVKKGTMQDVIIDEVDADGAFGRSTADAPDIDGCVFLNGDTEVKIGDIVRVRIEETDEYDMWGIRP